MEYSSSDLLHAASRIEGSDHLDALIYEGVWEHLCNHIEYLAQNQKAVNVGNAFMFLPVEYEDHLEWKFVLARPFRKKYNLTAGAKNITPEDIPSEVKFVHINSSVVAGLAGVAKKDASLCLRNLFTTLGKAMRSGLRVTLKMNLGKLVCRNRKTDFVFNRDFRGQHPRPLSPVKSVRESTPGTPMGSVWDGFDQEDAAESNSPIAALRKPHTPQILDLDGKTEQNGAHEGDESQVFTFEPTPAPNVSNHSSERNAPRLSTPLINPFSEQQQPESPSAVESSLAHSPLSQPRGSLNQSLSAEQRKELSKSGQISLYATFMIPDERINPPRTQINTSLQEAAQKEAEYRAKQAVLKEYLAEKKEREIETSDTAELMSRSFKKNQAETEKRRESAKELLHEYKQCLESKPSKRQLLESCPPMEDRPPVFPSEIYEEELGWHQKISPKWPVGYGPPRANHPKVGQEYIDANLEMMRQKEEIKKAEMIRDRELGAQLEAVARLSLEDEELAKMEERNAIRSSLKTCWDEQVKLHNALKGIRSGEVHKELEMQ